MSTHERAPKAHAIPRFPVLALLHPREQTRALILWLVLGTTIGMGAMRLSVIPAWSVTAVVLGLLLVPASQKWRSDAHRFGHTVMVLSVLLAAQGFHSLEHAVQMFQYHVLHWPPFASSGLISAANAEWVHFVWNWGVVAVVGYLVWNGVRNAWAWLLLGWALAHAGEHTYMLVRYLGLAHELQQLGFPQISAQGLPGVLGRDGWLARSTTTQGTFVCRLPGLTTASRIDVHFWWNTGETLVLLLTAHAFLRSHLSQLNAGAARAH